VSGATSRRKGTSWERTVAQLLRDVGFAAITSRAATGGAQNGYDIVTDAPVSVECKNVAKWDLSGWVDQAIGQADDCPAVVMIKRRGHPPERGYAVMRIDQYLHLLRKADM
jgi:hypothetical protein